MCVLIAYHTPSIYKSIHISKHFSDIGFKASKLHLKVGRIFFRSVSVHLYRELISSRNIFSHQIFLKGNHSFIRLETIHIFFLNHVTPCFEYSFVDCIVSVEVLYILWSICFI